MNNQSHCVLVESFLELIRKTSAELPPDIEKQLAFYSKQEERNTKASWAVEVMEKNIEIAKKKSAPLCQDTGSLLFYLYYPHSGAIAAADMRAAIEEAVVVATAKGYLRQNSLDAINGKNVATNVGPSHPHLLFEEYDHTNITARLVMKGGGCENVGAQYSLPYAPLAAGRDLEGIRKVILDAVFQAQGKGCSPGYLGVCIGGDRSSAYEESKRQFLRTADDENPREELRKMEKEIVESANELGIGPMGFGGKTTLFGCKIGHLNRLPASFFCDHFLYVLVISKTRSAAR